jgi:carbamoyltransferase
LAERDIPHERIADPDVRAARVAALLAGGAVVAVADGPGEFGPRALGARSILADPRSSTARSRLNLQVKRRESFRPFAPAVLADRVGDWFACDGPSPFMSFVVPVRGAIPVPAPPDGAPSEVVDLAARLDAIVSPLPAITHVDGSARLQTVDAERSPTLHAILRAFDAETGCPVLVNTSFNVRGEPIVSSAADAYECFLHTDIDWLLLEDALLERTAQPGSAPQGSGDDPSAAPS